MAEPGERLQVPPRPAAQVENRERRLALDVREQRRDVLADVVIARALPEVLRTLVVVVQGPRGDVVQVLPFEGHARTIRLRGCAVFRNAPVLTHQRRGTRSS